MNYECTAARHWHFQLAARKHIYKLCPYCCSSNRSNNGTTIRTTFGAALALAHLVSLLSRRSTRSARHQSIATLAVQPVYRSTLLRLQRFAVRLFSIFAWVRSAHARKGNCHTVETYQGLSADKTQCLTGLEKAVPVAAFLLLLLCKDLAGVTRIGRSTANKYLLQVAAIMTSALPGISTIMPTTTQHKKNNVHLVCVLNDQIGFTPGL